MFDTIEDVINDFDTEIEWIEHKLSTDRDEAIEMFRSLVFDTSVGIARYSAEYTEYCEKLLIEEQITAEEYRYQEYVDDRIIDKEN
jgi:hypothetical protein